MSEKARVAVALTLEGASQFARGVGMGTSAIQGMGGAVSRAGANLFHYMQIGKDVIGMTRRLASGVVSMADALLDPNEQFEVAQLQFEQLLGSADRAKEHIEGLYSYANSTPFLNPDVLAGGKVLYNIGGASLGAGKGLRMVGDMAAFADQQLTEMAGPVSRLYTMIQSGDAFGEEARRLMELGLLTGQQRNELVGLQKAGADGAQTWARFAEMMGKFDGQAAKISETFRGAKSTVAGLWGEIKRLTGQKLFAEVKGDVIGIRDDMSDAFATQRIQEFADKAGTAIAEIYRNLKDNSLGTGFTAEFLLNASEQGKLADVLSVIFTGAAQNFGKSIYNTLGQYGPDIQRALLPQSLHGILGITKGRQDAISNIAKGEFKREDFGNLGWRDKGTAMFAGAASGLRPDATREALQIWAQDQRQGFRPIPYTDIKSDLANLGVKPSTPDQLPPVPLGLPPGVSNAPTSEASRALVEQANAMIDALKSMNISMGEARDNAQELSESLGEARF